MISYDEFSDFVSLEEDMPCGGVSQDKCLLPSETESSYKSVTVVESPVEDGGAEFGGESILSPGNSSSNVTVREAVDPMVLGVDQISLSDLSNLGFESLGSVVS